MSTSQFMRQMDLFIEDAKKAQRKQYRAAVLALFTRIVMRTPVDKGVLRNNWYVSFTGYSEATTPNAAPTGGAAINRAKDAIRTGIAASEYLPEEVFITNNLPYATAIEYGHSGQAPEGMVRISLAEWEQIVNAVNNSQG